MEKITLRDRKAAQVRLCLMRTLRDKLEKLPFAEIKVDDLCEAAMISKVTFFKYFPAKEILLLFSNACWLLEFQVECRRRGLVGIPAIALQFQMLGEEYNRAPHYIRAFSSLLSQKDIPLSGIELTAAEKAEFLPNEDLTDFETRSVGNVIRKNVLHSMKAGHIHTELTESEIMALVGTLFNGTGILGLRIFPDRPGDLFQTNIQVMYKCLGYTGPKLQ